MDSVLQNVRTEVEGGRAEQAADAEDDIPREGAPRAARDIHLQQSAAPARRNNDGHDKDLLNVLQCGDCRVRPHRDRVQIGPDPGHSCDGAHDPQR